MKRKITTSNIITWITAAIMLLLVWIIIVNRPTSSSGWTSNRSISKSDSARIKSLRPGQTDINDGIKRESTIPFLSISTQEYVICDNCPDKVFRTWRGSEKDGIFRDYLIRLRGWKLRFGLSTEELGYELPVDARQVYRGNGGVPSLELEQAFMQKLYRKIDVPMPFRVDLDSRDIMIPLSKSTMNATYYALGALMAFFIVYILLFVVGDFIKFLIDVAQGNTFTLTNVNRLKFIALNLFIIPYGFFFINLCMPLIFSEYFTDEIMLDPRQWMDLGLPTILSLTFAALYTAFKKGKQLNDEAELTV